MSKFAIGLTAVTLTTGTSVGVVLLNGGVPGLGNGDQSEKPTDRKGYVALPKGAKMFRESKEGNDCIRDYFGDLDLSKKAPTLRQHIHKYDLLPSGSEAASPAESCLTVDWNRSDYLGDGKWRGDFQLLWTFAKGNKGLIIFTATENNRGDEVVEEEEETDDDGQFKMSQLIYVLEKRDGKWEVEEEQDEITMNDVASVDFDAIFPQLGFGIAKDFKYPKDLGVEENWGFMKGSGDVLVSCVLTNATSCQGMQLKHTFHETWRWSSEGTEPITGWSKNLKQWSDKVNNEWKLEDKLKDLKGSWSRTS